MSGCSGYRLEITNTFDLDVSNSIRSSPLFKIEHISIYPDNFLKQLDAVALALK